MTITPYPSCAQGKPSAGFTLVDVLVGSTVGALMFASLYWGLSHGLLMVRLGREDMRATQILQEKMETIWLYSWDQINDPGFMPKTFEANFLPATSDGPAGFTYHGSIEIQDPPMTEAYAKDLRMVTVKVRWPSGSTERQREMTTLVSRHGMHHYVNRRR